jgi:hypothetical protein
VDEDDIFALFEFEAVFPGRVCLYSACLGGDYSAAKNLAYWPRNDKSAQSGGADHALDGALLLFVCRGCRSKSDRSEGE